MYIRTHFAAIKKHDNRTDHGLDQKRFWNLFFMEIILFFANAKNVHKLFPRNIFLLNAILDKEIFVI